VGGGGPALAAPFTPRIDGTAADQEQPGVPHEDAQTVEDDRGRRREVGVVVNCDEPDRDAEGHEAEHHQCGAQQEPSATRLGSIVRAWIGILTFGGIIVDGVHRDQSSRVRCRRRDNLAGPDSSEGRRITVHVAFGQHLDLSHSYRGDTPTVDGFGLDFEVIGQTLDVLDEHPALRCDWDIECARALEDILPAHAPDLLDRLVQRVQASGDVVRHMSWGGEIMSALTEEELAESIARSRRTLHRIFGPGSTVEGCYPQECTYTPALPRRLTAAGVEWISLFYGACQFTAFRRDVRLEGAEAYNPLNLLTPEGDASIVLMPMYHHGDLADFGDLAAWCRHIHEVAAPGQDTLLHISFDADAITWPPFLRAAAPVLEELDFVRCTTVDRYLAAHPPLRDVTIHRDLADGAMDGYCNWSEKPVNFRLFTSVLEGRRRDADVETRLKALKTTNYGLATPHLHPLRVEAIDDFVAALGAPEFKVPDLGGSTPQLPDGCGRLAPHESALFSEPEPFGAGGVAFWVQVRFDAVEDDAVEPCAIVLDCALPLTVHKADFTGARSAYEVVVPTDSVNNHLTPGWAAFSRPDGSGVLVAFDDRVLAAPAGMPLRVRDGEVRVNPFGTYWGAYPDWHPEWTGGSGGAAQVVPVLGSHCKSSAPAFAGTTLTFRLGVLPFSGEVPMVPAFS